MDAGVARAPADAEAEADVARLVLGDAAHPAVVGIGRIGALLKDAQGVTATRAQLVPADADRATGGDAVIDDQRLVVAEVAVGEAVHEAVGKGVQLLRSARLRDAGAAGASLREGCRRQRGRPGQGRIGGRGPIRMELPVSELVGRGALGDDVVGRASRRRLRSVQIGCEQATEGCAEVEALLGGRLAGQHLCPVVGAGLAAAEGGAAGEHVESDVVRVRPHRQLRVVREVVVLEGVTVVGARRVGGLGDGHALQVGRGRDRELADQPAVRDGVVLGDRVAVVVGLAAAAEAAPKGVDGDRAEDRGARLVEDREVAVDDLYHVVGPDRQVGVGGSRAYGEGTRGSAEPIPDTVELEAHRRRRRGRGRGWGAGARTGPRVGRRDGLGVVVLMVAGLVQVVLDDLAQGQGDVLVDGRCYDGSGHDGWRRRADGPGGHDGEESGH